MLKYYLQNMCIFTGKNIVLNFEIINFKIKIIMLLANTSQTMQI